MNLQQAPSARAIGRTRQPYRVGLFTFLLVFPLALLSGLIRLHTYYVYQTYQQGQCTILSGTTDYYSTRDSQYYTADLQYIVSTKDGQQVTTDGYDGPYTSQFDTQDEAQQIVDSYQVGQSYPCWYNPAAPYHAVLIFRGYNTNDFFIDYIETSLLYLLGYSFLWLLLYYVFYRQLCLIRRGVLTQGTVVENVVRRTRRGKTTTSRIAFSPRDDPSRSYKIMKAGAFNIGHPMTVCYDPLNPKNAKQGDRPGWKGTITALAIACVGILIAGGAFLIIWFAV